MYFFTIMKLVNRGTPNTTANRIAMNVMRLVRCEVNHLPNLIGNEMTRYSSIVIKTVINTDAERAVIASGTEYKYILCVNAHRSQFSFKKEKAPIRL